MGLPGSGFLSSMHSHIVAMEWTFPGIYSLLCPKSCSFTLFHISQDLPSSGGLSCVVEVLLPSPDRNFPIRLFFPILFHQLSSAGRKPGKVPSPLLWGKEIFREQYLESLYSRSKLWCGFCARFIILPTRSWDNLVFSEKDRLSVRIFEFHQLKKEKVHDT